MARGKEKTSKALLIRMYASMCSTTVKDIKRIECKSHKIELSGARYGYKKIMEAFKDIYSEEWKIEDRQGKRC